MNDDYRTIEGYPGYRVSSTGEVQSCWVRRGRSSHLSSNWRPLTPIERLGYLSVNLTQGCGKKKARSIHRLVLEAFVGACPDGSVACHNDGDPANNRLSNLRWDTHQSNCDDKLRHGTLCWGEAARHAKLRQADVLEIRHLSAAGHPAKSLAERFKIGPRNVRAIVRGRTWRHLSPPCDQPVRSGGLAA